MTDPAKIPNDPVAFIQRCVHGGRISWTYHVNMRLSKRGIGRDHVIAAVDTYAVIESYPDDKYLPSYLVLGQSSLGSLHILFATDVARDNVRVITAYRPDPAEWSADFRSRLKA